MTAKKMNNPGVEIYELNPDSSVKLTIRIGYAQAFVSSVYLDNIPIKTNQGNPKGVIDVDLPGNGLTLNGKYLRCYTHVTDTTPETDLTNVSYEFKGGRGRAVFEQTAKTTPSKKVEFFNAEFLFYI